MWLVCCARGVLVFVKNAQRRREVESMLSTCGGFTIGFAAGFTLISLALQTALPRTPLREAKRERRGSLPEELEEVHGRELRPQTSYPGHCGETTDGQSGDCQVGDFGMTRLSKSHVRTWQTATAECTRRCQECSRCKYISTSREYRDCSWYASCDVHGTKLFSDFRSMEVQPADAHELEDSQQSKSKVRRRRRRRHRRRDDATAADGTADGTADGATVEGATIVGTTADVSSPSQLPMPPPRSTSLTLPTVAACVGGLLDLDIIAQGLSVRLGVIEPLQADVFVAGTLNASVAEVVRGGAAWARRIALGREHIVALEPFVKAFEVERQLSGEEMRAALERSGFGPAFARQVSGAGAGRLDPNHEDPRQWLPTMLSPAFGNPQGNTLREFHYQSRCMRMIEKAEAERRAEYSRVLFTRLEFLWLHAHPPLSLLDPSRVWVPAVEDNGGVNDRHWLVSRRVAPALMRRWEALLDGSALSAIHGSRAADGHAGVRPRFLSSEMFLFEYARYVNDP